MKENHRQVFEAEYNQNLAELVQSVPVQLQRVIESKCVIYLNERGTPKMTNLLGEDESVSRKRLVVLLGEIGFYNLKFFAEDSTVYRS